MSRPQRVKFIWLQKMLVKPVTKLFTGCAIAQSWWNNIFYYHLGFC